MYKRVWFALLVGLLAAVLAAPVAADVSAFVGYVGFDDEANLDSSPAIGLRWGKSSGFIGGETSLMIARPERDLGRAGAENATALFYEGRIIVNIPLGDYRPFVNVGYGAITTTSTDFAEEGLPDSELEALAIVADLQTKQAFSYGVGLRYALSERMDLRADIRQYQVFSVAGVASAALEHETGVEIRSEDSTVQYSEMSVGFVINF